MATVRWRGDAPTVAQVTTATPASIEVGDIFTLTINGKSISYTAAATTVAHVVAGLVSAWNGSNIPKFSEVTASDTTTEATLTADTAGRPFTVTGSTTNGGAADTQTLTVSTTTVSSRPNHWDTTANWTGGALPGAADDVYIDDSDVSIKYGLAQSAVNLSSLHLAASFTGELGLARTNTDGSTDYAEFSDTFLAIGAATIDIGRGEGLGSGRIQLDTGSVNAAVTIHSGGLPAEDDLPAVLWKGTGASNSLSVRDGPLGVALFGGEAATLPTLRQVGGQVRCGAGVTLTTIDRSGHGSLLIESTAGTITQTGGETIVLGSGAVSTVSLDGGRLDYRSGGTITTLTLDGPGAVLDFSADLRSRTVTAATLRGSTILEPHETVTWTGGVQPATGVQAV